MKQFHPSISPVSYLTLERGPPERSFIGTESRAVTSLSRLSREADTSRDVSTLHPRKICLSREKFLYLRNALPRGSGPQPFVSRRNKRKRTNHFVKNHRRDIRGIRATCPCRGQDETSINKREKERESERRNLSSLIVRRCARTSTLSVSHIRLTRGQGTYLSDRCSRLIASPFGATLGNASSPRTRLLHHRSASGNLPSRSVSRGVRAKDISQNAERNISSGPSARLDSASETVPRVKDPAGSEERWSRSNANNQASLGVIIPCQSNSFHRAISATTYVGFLL